MGCLLGWPELVLAGSPGTAGLTAPAVLTCENPVLAPDAVSASLKYVFSARSSCTSRFSAAACASFGSTCTSACKHWMPPQACAPAQMHQLAWSAPEKRPRAMPLNRCHTWLRQEDPCRKGTFEMSVPQTPYHSTNIILLRAQAAEERQPPSVLDRTLSTSCPGHTNVGCDSHQARAEEVRQEAHACRTGRLRMFLARVA